MSATPPDAADAAPELSVEVQCRFCTRQAVRSGGGKARLIANLDPGDAALLEAKARSANTLKDPSVLHYCSGCSRDLTVLRAATKPRAATATGKKRGLPRPGSPLAPLGTPRSPCLLLAAGRPARSGTPAEPDPTSPRSRPRRSDDLPASSAYESRGDDEPSTATKAAGDGRPGRAGGRVLRPSKRALEEESAAQSAAVPGLGVQG